ncbi:tetrathionate reductase family octaheme c-type cytochrome [Herbaspirillum sp. ST 5-3]|uniref:tetrathionate reductase family octaheme c-type cytochrome n=1 Tax=Oxalobacteraceae TaxID=75682 RepID=UPI001B3BE85B|nr:tetrathionate reductase family octaheme c-type cytochrome [Herbaspirillum sp. ST 5-3]
MRFRAFTAAACIFVAASLAHAATDQLPARLFKSTADHGKFTALQQDFKSGPEVTKACLSCHTEASKQIHTTQHWKWEYRNPATGQLLGKKHLINNFCTSASSNMGGCASCHIGYGWKDDSFDFASEENVDCLVCHDTTGKYRKPGGFAGNVVTRDTEYPPGSGKIIRGIDLKQIAQRVGSSRRANCGACHFSGGGGDGVKHGDLDSSLEAPGKVLDVHMDTKGNNFTCTTCHKTEGHQVPGSRYAPTAMENGDQPMRGKADKANPTTCRSCHTATPHKKTAKLNDHTDKIACQTCHIPTYARGGVPTKMSWDWSTAGKRGPDGKPLVVRNDDGYDVYMGIKGDFVWGENVKPEYVWFNGTVTYTLLGDKIEKSAEPVQINKFEGSASDGKSMIWPVKIFRGKQAYDPVNKTLVVTHLAGNDDSAYWTNLNWEKAVATGMKSVNAPFSGKVDFISTESTWPITHMVAPKERALDCVECHSSAGRLEKVSGIYIPGRSSDHASWLDGAGWTIAALALLGVVLHGLGRVIAFFRNK